MRARGKTCVLPILLGALLLPTIGHAFDQEIFLGGMPSHTVEAEAEVVDVGFFSPTVTENANADVEASAVVIGYRGLVWSGKHPSFGGGFETCFLDLEAEGGKAGVSALGLGGIVLLRFNRPSGWIQPYLGAGLTLYLGTINVDLTPEVSRNAEGNLSGSAMVDLRAGVLFPVSGKTAFFVEGRQMSGSFEGVSDELFSDDRVTLSVNAPVITGGFSFRQ